MTPRETDLEEHKARSVFVRRLVHRAREPDLVPVSHFREAPRTIVQFWDDLGQLPDDVAECMQSWKRLEARGFEIRVFDANEARQLIASRLGPRHENAYGRCYHPAMQADYFRLCYIFVEGGCYLDADDVHCGVAIEHLFSDGRLKLQPLCYDMSTNQMVPPEVFTQPGADSGTWIFYFNNNPMLAAPGHPIVKRALANATRALECYKNGELPDIQSTTGPGNLTHTIFEFVQQNGAAALRTLLVLPDWEGVATSRWPLSYRHDARNWRLSDRKKYRSLLRGDA